MHLKKYQTRHEIEMLADTLRQRADVGWNTLLSPETTILVASALSAYMPAPPSPRSSPPDTRFHVNMYASGSTIYRLTDSGEIESIAAWAKNSLIAAAAFDALVDQYPKGRFEQRRKSWVERD